MGRSEFEEKLTKIIKRYVIASFQNDMLEEIMKITDETMENVLLSFDNSIPYWTVSSE